MARAAKAVVKEEPVAKKKPGTAITKWDQALAARSKVAAKAVEHVAGGGDWVSFKGGTITFKDQAIGNELEVIIPSFVLENVYYEGKYDPNNPESPICYAFGQDEDSMAPHEAVVKAGNAQSETCTGCPHNEWDSGEGGRGKACKNQVRLAVLPADCLDGGAKGVEDAKEAFAKIPVTSVKAWGSFVNQLAGVGMHPLAVVAQINVAPDPQTQFKLGFKAIETLDDGDIIGALIDRADKLDASIGFPYPKFEPRPAPKTRARVAREPAAGKAPARGAAAPRPTRGAAKAEPAAAPKTGRRKF